jgi:hypothetical protein
MSLRFFIFLQQHNVTYGKQPI